MELPENLKGLEEVLTPTQLLQLKAKLKRADQRADDFADIQSSIEYDDLPIEIYTLDLTNGYDQYNPFEISFPFKGFWVYEASDPIVTAKLHLNSKKIPHILKGLPIKTNFAVNFPRTVGVAYITAPPQTGKTISIVVIKDGTIDPGSTISQNAGGISINEGSAITTRDKTGLTLTGAAASVVAPSDLYRVVETLVNMTGVTLYLGDANVTDFSGNYPGTPWPHGAAAEWRNTSELYAYNPSATISNANISRNEGT